MGEATKKGGEQEGKAAVGRGRGTGLQRRAIFSLWKNFMPKLLTTSSCQNCIKNPMAFKVQSSSISSFGEKPINDEKCPTCSRVNFFLEQHALVVSLQGKIYYLTIESSLC